MILIWNCLQTNNYTTNPWILLDQIENVDINLQDELTELLANLEVKILFINSSLSNICTHVHIQQKYTQNFVLWHFFFASISKFI